VSAVDWDAGLRHLAAVDAEARELRRVFAFVVLRRPLVLTRRWSVRAGRPEDGVPSAGVLTPRFMAYVRWYR